MAYLVLEVNESTSITIHMGNKRNNKENMGLKNKGNIRILKNIEAKVRLEISLRSTCEKNIL